MIAFTKGLYVRIHQNDGGPRPLPLDSGFSNDCAYLVLGGFTMSESSEMFLCLSNDKEQMWFISNRQVATHCVSPDSTSLRFKIGGTK